MHRVGGEQLIVLWETSNDLGHLVEVQVLHLALLHFRGRVVTHELLELTRNAIQHLPDVFESNVTLTHISNLYRRNRSS